MTIRLYLALGVLGVVAGSASPASAHGLAGNRFFPATLAIDDPFVADELTLPSVLHVKGPDGTQTTLGAELSKTITPNFGLSVGAAYNVLDPNDPGDGHGSGFDNPDVSAKYVLFTSDAHEAIVSIGFGAEPGGVGQKSGGAASFTTLSPALFFGKGLGDLPDTLACLRPLAVTGVVGADLPLSTEEPDALTYGFAVEYSLPYLQQFVKDIGIPPAAGRIFPVVELLFSTPIDGGKTTGTVNPGAIWAGKYVELGVEAVIPVNGTTGKNVGVRGLVHFFLDDLYPAAFRPLLR
jgi:hypothetical protein